MPMVGADPEELDALGRQMGSSAERLAAIRAEITSILAMTSWSGADAEMFQSDWSGHLSGTLAGVGTALTDASSKLHFEAEQQRQASGVSGADSQGDHSLLDALGNVFGMPGTILSIGTLPMAIRSLYRLATLPGDLSKAISSELLSGASQVGAEFDRNAEIATGLFRNKAFSDAISGGLGGLGTKVGVGLGVFGILGDALTIANPDFKGTAGAVEQGAAGVNAAATGLSIVTTLAPGLTAEGAIFGADAALSWVPVAGEVAIVGTGVYLAGAYMYSHVQWFHDGVDAAWQGATTVAGDVAGGIAQGASDVAQGVAQGATDVAHGVETGVSDAASVVSTGVQDVASGVSNVASSVTGGISNAASSVANFFGL